MLSIGLATLIGCATHRELAPSPPDGPEPPVLYLGARPLHPGIRSVTLLPGDRMAVLRLPVHAGRIVPPAAVTRRPSDVFTLVVAEGTRVELAGGKLMRARRTQRTTAYVAPRRPGAYRMRLHPPDRPAVDFTVLVLTPFAQKQRGMLGGYRIGDYPEESGLSFDRPGTRTMRGFVEVTPAGESLPLSTHFRLGDLLCKQQPEQVPKYLMVDVRLIDKLERLVDRLHASGFPVRGLAVMSGYRTPQYNRAIGNDTIWSRHTVGDAADVFVDDDRDGKMDDLDGNGAVTIEDAQLLMRMVEDLDDDPRLVGGASVYPSTPEHGPFVHVDTRGYRARW